MVAKNLFSFCFSQISMQQKPEKKEEGAADGIGGGERDGEGERNRKHVGFI